MRDCAGIAPECDGAIHHAVVGHTKSRGTRRRLGQPCPRSSAEFEERRGHVGREGLAPAQKGGRVVRHGSSGLHPLDQLAQPRQWIRAPRPARPPWPGGRRAAGGAGAMPPTPDAGASSRVAAGGHRPCSGPTRFSTGTRASMKYSWQSVTCPVMDRIGGSRPRGSRQVDHQQAEPFAAPLTPDRCGPEGSSSPPAPRGRSIS